MRWVRKNRRVHAGAHCTLCGVHYGASPGRKCPPATCPACGTRQCQINGLSNGTCGVCLVGLLPGWGQHICGYKGCGQPAVAQSSRVKYVCQAHLERAGLTDQIQARLAARPQEWQEVED